MFVCQSCGQQSVAPTEECTSMVRLQYSQTEILMPCSAWPLTPDEYIARKALVSGLDSYFSGTVMLPDGVIIEVSAPIPNETAAEIAVVSVAHALSLKRIEKRKEEGEHHEEAVARMRKLGQRIGGNLGTTEYLRQDSIRQQVNAGFVLPEDKILGKKSSDG